MVDYGAGNLHSVAKAYESAGANVVLTSSAAEILAAECVILPGVGAFGDGMRGLEERGLVGALQEYAATGRPLMGICLGMQLFFDRSEEFGNEKGLGIIPGDVVAVPRTAGVKVPHVGWNDVKPVFRPSEDDAATFEGTPLEGVTAGEYFYFCHSFTARPRDAEDAIGVTRYGDAELVVAVSRGNVWGTQYHPEKSGPVGLDLLRRFLERTVAKRAA